MYITMFKTKYFWFIILIILALAYSYITHKNELEYTEGFSQGKHFVLKTDSMAPPSRLQAMPISSRQSQLMP